MCEAKVTKQELLKKLKTDNLLSLAFLGDSVHTNFVREFVLSNFVGKMDDFNGKASSLCKASTQAKVLEKILHSLSEEESEIVRRARNAKPKHQAKNASVKDYSYATAFEALIGYLYLSENTERLNEILLISVQKD